MPVNPHGPAVQASQRHTNLRLQVSLRRKTWFWFQVFVPLAVVLAILIGNIFVATPYAFYKVLAGGDLHLIGAMLLLGLAVDIICRLRIDPRLRLLTSLDTHWITALALGFVLMLLYGMTSALPLLLTFPAPPAPLDWSLRGVALLSIGSVVFAVMWGCLCIFASTEAILRTLQSASADTE